MDKEPVAGKVKRSHLVTQFKEFTKNSQVRTKEIEARATFMVNSCNLKAKGHDYWERLFIKVVINEPFRRRPINMKRKKGLPLPSQEVNTLARSILAGLTACLYANG